MVRFHTSAEINEDRRVVLELPPETPTGKADLTVTIAFQAGTARAADALRRYFGSIRSGAAAAANNDRIDADLARAYEDSHDEAT